VVRLLMSINSMTHVVSERKIFLKFGQSETRLTLQSEQYEVDR
jgi:predicted HTH domain antitoxin